MPPNLNHISAALRVCVDHAEEGHLNGRVFSQRLKEPLHFTDIGNLLLQMEDVLDQQEFPQAYQRTRTFAKGERAGSAPAANGEELGMTEAVVAAALGSVTTFIIYVITRRNTTWQGKLDWLDGEPAEAYSSVLELIKRIDHHLVKRE